MPKLSPEAAADLFRRPPDRMLDLGGVRVAHRVVGTGPDVLFVHGWPVAGATWRRLLPLLADGFTCHVIDLPGSGASTAVDPAGLSVAGHIATVTGVVDALGLDDLAVVGHDSGGLIARYALAGDPRVRAMGLIDTEQSKGLTWRFQAFLAARRLPGIGAALGWVFGRPRLRRHPLLLGGAFVDQSLLDGEFDEFFLRPLREDPARRAEAVRVLRSFSRAHVHGLAAVHRRIEVPVHLVWGERDRFFPVARAREMLREFPDARLTAIPQAALFPHEERPALVAEALAPTLAGRG
ncbi:MAG: alpha/beta fold hydrolase [Sporichthyaceae bacterium]